MDLELFANLLKQETLQEEDVNSLKQIINKYPYFQSARALYLKGLKNTENFNYDTVLKTTAIYTTDRNVLYNYIVSSVFMQNEASKFIKQNKFHLNTLHVEADDISVDKSVIIDDALSKEIESSEPVLDPALFQPMQESDKIDGLKITKATKSFQINTSTNTTILGATDLNRDFTIALKEVIQNQTNLEFVTLNGHVAYEVEITTYEIGPTTTENAVEKDQLKIDVKVNFYNTKNEEDNFKKTFSSFHNFSDNELTESTKAIANNKVLKRLTQDIFNASLAK